MTSPKRKILITSALPYAIDRKEAVRVDTGGLAETGTVQHRRPEQRMEIDDVLANEVIQLGI